MLISLKKNHREHLQYLTLQPVNILENFCQLATQFLQEGTDPEQYHELSQKLQVETDTVQNCIYGIVHLLLLSCKHKLSEADFRDSVLTLGFSSEHQLVLSKYYAEKQTEIHEVLKVPIQESHFDDLRWRFEAIVSSRSLLHQATPIITLELSTKTEENGTLKKESQLLQTDPNNLLHLVNELEKAYMQTKSRHFRKVERALKN